MERYSIANAMDKGKYHNKEIHQARTKEHYQQLKVKYMMLKKEYNKVGTFLVIRKLHCGYPRAKMLMAEIFPVKINLFLKFGANTADITAEAKIQFKNTTEINETNFKSKLQSGLKEKFNIFEIEDLSSFNSGNDTILLISIALYENHQDTAEIPAIAKDIEDSIKEVEYAIDNGIALNTLNKLIEVTNDIR